MLRPHLWNSRCALQRGAAELSDPSPSSPAGAVSLGHSQDSKTGHCWGTVFGSANCIGPHWDIPMLGEGPDGHVPPVSPTRRVSELERPQPSPGWGRFFRRRTLIWTRSQRPQRPRAVGRFNLGNESSLPRLNPHSFAEFYDVLGTPV